MGGKGRDVKGRGRQPNGGQPVYGLGMIGAWVYYWRSAATNGDRALGVLKGLAWPAFLVYEAFSAVGRAKRSDWTGALDALGHSGDHIDEELDLLEQLILDEVVLPRRRRRHLRPTGRPRTVSRSAGSVRHARPTGSATPFLPEGQTSTR